MVVMISVDWIIGAVFLAFLLVPLAGIVITIIDFVKWRNRR